MSDSNIAAPGWPGIPPRWTSSAKSGVGTALNRGSRVWFTLSHGILNEIYYPARGHGLHPRPGADGHRWQKLFLRRRKGTANLKSLPLSLAFLRFVS